MKTLARPHRTGASILPAFNAPWLLLKELRTRLEILEYFRVRHTVYLGSGYIQPHPHSVDIDCFDPHCRFIGAFDLRKPGSPLIGGARMILSQQEPNRALVDKIAEQSEIHLAARPHTYMAQGAFDLTSILEYCASFGHTLVEFGRTVCLPEYRNLGVGTALVHAIHGLGLRYQVDQAVACGKLEMLRYYENFGCRHLPSKGIGRVNKLKMELVCLVLDLPSLLGPCRSAHQTAGQLARYERVLMCEHRRCLEWHNHHPKFQSSIAWEEPAQRSQPRLKNSLNVLPGDFQLHDETLRDGLQSPSVRTPALADKLEILRAMARLGVESANLGLPGAGERFLEECSQLLKTLAAENLAIQPTLAGRTCFQDVDAIIEASQRAGLRTEAGLFIGSSKIRQFCEEWDLDDLLRLTATAVARAVRADIPVMFVTEDTTRAHPHILRKLFLAAIENGAQRLCLCDTVGQATPAGVRALVRFARSVIEESGAAVKLDWHGHQDRGLSLVNSLAAIEAGVNRVHGTALGMGERVGNTALEQLLFALQQQGTRDFQTQSLRDYLELVARLTRRSFPYQVDESLLRLERFSLLKSGAR